MRQPPPPSARPLSGHRSHLKSSTADTLLRLFSLFPTGLPFQYGPAPRPPLDPSPPPPPPSAEAGIMSAAEAAPPAIDGTVGRGEVVGASGVLKNSSLSDKKIGRVTAGGVSKKGSLADGKTAGVAEGSEIGPALVRKKGSLSDEKIGRVVKSRKRGAVSIEVGLDATISPDLLTGEVSVESMDLDQNQGNGENFFDLLVGGSAIEGDMMVEENAVEVNPGVFIDSDDRVEPCKSVEAAGCKNADLLEKEEVEEGEIPEEAGLPILPLEEDTAVVHGIDEKEAQCSAKKDFAPDVPISSIKVPYISGECRSKVDYGGLSELANVVMTNPDHGRSFMAKDKKMKSVRQAPCPQMPSKDKRMVKTGDIASSEKGDGACEIKKKQGSVSEHKKAKKKMAKKRKRAEQNKKLGVKRLKLVPVSKPKEVKICKHYLNGRCQLGDKCKFSHDAIPVTKSQPCKYFARSSCLKGDDCPYDHELSKYPCDNYVSRGSCVRGDTCLFSHKVELSQNPSNARDAKCSLAAERADLGGKLQGNNSSPLVSNSLLRAGSSTSMTSTLPKNSLPRQLNDLNSAQKSEFYTVKTPPEGITFLSFGTDTTTSNKLPESPKKDIENNPLFNDKMLSPAFSMQSPSWNHKMVMPTETNNLASSSRENHGSDIVAPSLRTKMQSDEMDASQLLDYFLFNN